MADHIAPIQAPDGPAPASLDKLNPFQRAFVLHYVLGEEEIRGIAYKCYMAAGYDVDKNSASVSSTFLLRNPKIKNAIADLRSEVEREALSRMKSWGIIAGKAQVLLERAIDTKLNPKVAEATNTATHLSTEDLQGIKEVLDRALGKPKQRIEKDIGDNLTDVVKRMQDRRRQPSLAAPAVDENNLGDFPRSA